MYSGHGETINLLPGPDERAIAIGDTGSGKSTFMAWMLSQVRRRMPVIVFDTKPDDVFLLPGALVVTTFADLRRAEAPYIVYRPATVELADPDALAEALQHSYERGNSLTHISEITQVNPGRKPSIALLNLLSRGRMRQVDGRDVSSPLWMETQLPIDIPAWCFSQSSRFYMFRLEDGRYRKRVAEFTHPDFKENPGQRYGFRYKRSGDFTAYELGPLRVGVRPLQRRLA